jgi:AIPR protein
VPKDIPAFASYIARRLDEVGNELDISPYDAWAFVVADLLGYDPDVIETFQNKDTGIDFTFRSERTFEIYQCKMHQIDDAGELEIKQTFGPDGLNDIQRALQFLFSEVTPPSVDARLVSFREQLRAELELAQNTDEEDPAPTVIVSSNLVTLGDNLSPACKPVRQAIQRTIRGLQERYPQLKINYSHIGLSSLAENWEGADAETRKPEPIRLRFAFEQLHFDEARDAAISARNFITFYTPAVDLVSAAKKEGVALFDANVRYELSSSNINEQIRTGASHVKTMKTFHLYNNGVTITGAGWSFRNNRQAIEIVDPSIINGCQTVRSLKRVREDLEQEAEDKQNLLNAFDENCLVMVRLINKNSVNADELVRAANTQNAMEPRNLLSNRIEQRANERELAGLGWFYERKDGSLDALKEAKKSSLGIQISAFQVRKERSALTAYSDTSKAEEFLSSLAATSFFRRAAEICPCSPGRCPVRQILGE